MFIREAGDWRQPYSDLFQYSLWPLNHTDTMKIQKKSSMLFMEGGPFKRNFNQAPLKCIARDEVAKVPKEVHARDYSEQSRDSRLFE